MKTAVAVGLLLISTLAAVVFLKLINSNPLLVLVDEYWGPRADEGKLDDVTISPFQINVTNLSQSASKHDDDDYVHRTTFIRTGTIYPQFTTVTGGLSIHFYHVKPPKELKCSKLPLLLVHGWPSTVVEYYNVIDLVKKPNDSPYCYEVVILSLPGYGLSSAAKRRDFPTVQIENILKGLTDRLRHKKFLFWVATGVA